MPNYVVVACDTMAVPDGVIAIHREITYKEVRKVFAEEQWINIAPPTAWEYLFERAGRWMGVKFPAPTGGSGVELKSGDKVLRCMEYALQDYGFQLVELG